MPEWITVWLLSPLVKVLLGGLLPVVISILAFRRANEAATAATYALAVGPALDLDKAFIENPDLRPYFYENKRLDPSETNHGRVLALAEMSLDCFQIILTQIREHPSRVTDAQKNADIAWVTDMFKTSEVLRDFLKFHKDWYSKDVQDCASPAPCKP